MRAVDEKQDIKLLWPYFELVVGWDRVAAFPQ